MRPLKLVMNAFGPYKEKVVIDFTQFHHQTLFLVSGPTGAGKTTIFDAIAYALYDDASGTSRGKDSFKSQFVSDDVLCFVELEFELAGKKYFIKRIPEQKGPGKNGKLKKWSSEVEFHHNGTVTTKIKEANKEIQELLSLSYEQFKQIVMLPQGEFKKMLESNSADKEKIFRNIFQTDTIKELQSLLKDKASSLKQGIDQNESTLQQFVGMITKGVNETLEEAIRLFDIPVIITELSHLVESHQEKIHLLEKELIALDETYHNNQRKIDLIAALAVLEKEKESLEANKELIETKRSGVSLAKKAEECFEIKQQVENISNEKRAIQQELIKEQKQLAETSERLLETEENYHVLQSAHRELPKKREVLADLKEQEKQLCERAAKEEARTELVKENQNNQQVSQELNKQLIADGAQLKKQEHELKEIQQAKTSIMEKQREVGSLQQEQHQTKKQQEALIEFSKYLAKKDAKQEEFQEIENKYTQIESHYQEQRLTYNRNIAGMLASDLKEEQECPVCGSLHHPAPAKLGRNSVSKEALEESEAQKNEIGKLFDRISIELKGLSEAIQSSEKQLAIQQSEVPAELAKIQRRLSEEAEKQEKLTEIVKALQKTVDNEETAEKEKQKTALQVRETESEIQLLKAAVEHNAKRIDELKGEIDTLITKLTATSLSAIQVQIDEKTNEISRIEEGYSKAQENKVDLEKLQTQYQTSTKAFEKQLSTLIEREVDRQIVFTEQLAAKQLDATFEKYLLGKETKQQLIEETEAFDKKNWLNQTNFSEKRKALEKEGPDQPVEGYVTKNQEIELESKTLKEQQRELIGIEKTNQSILSQIQLNDHAKKEEQEEYLLYKELSEMANGSKETDYISFERFVLGIYFEEIIEAANTRFTQMTINRYALIRNKDKTKGAGPKGLDLDVFDNYTGMKRSVKTLSGGESFKASLALALGLSDVVQNRSGGVSVDTLFIDEGFGTLDAESIDSAIETLFELNQRGRLVGVISHVEELKTRIPVHIEVTKSSNGSYATIKV
ncbi:SMC family ATPase [Carnobacterium sp. ISL-102]|uniref:AAA family ATPase n=1 Tax=Carnobacterium sp. ISL-102 TaxID=2819142 RepID=UPI001BEC98DD|nr:SMC family ATPase [Carnobacterium sp. ISL-102]MBT2731931.1 SMC family ATPase [Carnobacterium sp. ISL-102]